MNLRHILHKFCSFQSCNWWKLPSWFSMLSFLWKAIFYVIGHLESNEFDLTNVNGVLFFSSSRFLYGRKFKFSKNIDLSKLVNGVQWRYRKEHMKLGPGFMNLVKILTDTSLTICTSRVWWGFFFIIFYFFIVL